jgi:hypothetical protein
MAASSLTGYQWTMAECAEDHEELEELLAAPRPSASHPKVLQRERVNESEHCAILHKSDRTCNLPK